MKKVNAFSLIAITALCTTILHGAVPPAQTTAEQIAVQAFQQAMGTKLAQPAPQIIPIKVINSNRKCADLEVNFYNAQTGQKIIDTFVTAYVNPFQPTSERHEEKTIFVPLIPLKLTVNNVQVGDCGLADVIRVIGSFELSIEKLRSAKSIAVNHEFLEIQDNNGMTHRQEYSKAE